MPTETKTWWYLEREGDNAPYTVRFTELPFARNAVAVQRSLGVACRIVRVTRKVAAPPPPPVRVVAIELAAMDHMITVKDGMPVLEQVNAYVNRYVANHMRWHYC